MLHPGRLDLSFARQDKTTPWLMMEHTGPTGFEVKHSVQATFTNTTRALIRVKGVTISSDTTKSADKMSAATNLSTEYVIRLSQVSLPFRTIFSSILK